MRNLEINKKEFVALNYLGKESIVDSQGKRTGESKVLYGDEIVFKTHISGASGVAVIDSNGISIEYDKSFILTRYLFEKVGFTENTVFFIDKTPEDDANGQPLYDYKVKRIKDTLNEVLILLEKVRNN